MKLLLFSKVGTFGFDCTMGACDFIVSPDHPAWLQVYFMYTGYIVSLILMLFSYTKVLVLLRKKRNQSKRKDGDNQILHFDF